MALVIDYTKFSRDPAGRLDSFAFIHGLCSDGLIRLAFTVRGRTVADIHRVGFTRIYVLCTNCELWVLDRAQSMFILDSK